VKGLRPKVKRALISQDLFQTASYRFGGRADIFFGPNALGHALDALWHKGRPGDALDTSETYHTGQKDAPLWASCCWREGDKPYEVASDAPYVVGGGGCVHAKVYVVYGVGVVITSQNNGHSMLVEAAIALHDEYAAEWFSEQIAKLEKAVGGKWR
jgi:hypothetical protein